MKNSFNRQVSLWLVPSAVEIWGMLLLRAVEPNSGFPEEKTIPVSLLDVEFSPGGLY